jgi:hypothetical protein
MKTKNKPQAAQPALANSARPRHASGPSAPRPKRSKAQECYQAALGWLSLTAHTRTAATLHGKLRRRPVTVATARNLPPPLPIRYRPSSAACRHRSSLPVRRATRSGRWAEPLVRSPDGVRRLGCSDGTHAASA